MTTDTLNSLIQRQRNGSITLKEQQDLISELITRHEQWKEIFEKLPDRIEAFASELKVILDLE